MEESDLAVYLAGGYVLGKTALNVYLYVTYKEQIKKCIKESFSVFPENPLPKIETYLKNQTKRYEQLPKSNLEGIIG